MARPVSPSDAELIDEFLGGQATAFDALVRRYETALLGFLARMTGDGPLAEDLFQETFLRIMQALPDYRERGRFRSWLFSVARNLALDALRRRRFEHGIFRHAPASPDGAEDGDDPVADGIAAEEDAPDALAERAEWAGRLERAIAQLSEEQREVLALRAGAGLTFREIAEITGVSINTALGRMRYATIALRRKLAEYRAEDMT